MSFNLSYEMCLHTEKQSSRPFYASFSICLIPLPSYSICNTGYHSPYLLQLHHRLRKSTQLLFYRDTQTFPKSVWRQKWKCLRMAISTRALSSPIKKYKWKIMLPCQRKKLFYSNARITTPLPSPNYVRFIHADNQSLTGNGKHLWDKDVIGKATPL